MSQFFLIVFFVVLRPQRAALEVLKQMGGRGGMGREVERILTIAMMFWNDYT